MARFAECLTEIQSADTWFPGFNWPSATWSVFPETCKALMEAEFGTQIAFFGVTESVAMES
jgi:hypothetical protein